MFIKELSDKEYGVAIVGAGPAGITLALRLAEKTQGKILLIESGRLEKKSKIQKLSEVEATGDFPSKYYPKHAQRRFGGSSSVWQGVCAALEKRAFLTNEWPINYQDISRYYPDAAEILEVPKESYETPTQKLGKHATIEYRTYYLSPPVRFHKKYETQLRNHPKIDVLLNTTCTDIRATGNVIDGLLLRDSEGKSETPRFVKAKQYVLACGGIGNPRLMKLAGIAAKSPVGNYFMEHPHILFAGKWTIDKKKIDPFLVHGRTRHSLQLTDDFCAKNNLMSFSNGFNIDRVENRPLLGEMKPVYVSWVLVVGEMAALSENRISLSDRLDHLNQPKAAVDFKFNYQALGEKMWGHFARELLASGLGRMPTPPLQRFRITGGGHYIGTTRMGTAAKNSVVDMNCKVHTIDNLYVAGSSVFSSAAVANPTFSIVALALRLADFLSPKNQG